MDEADRGKVMNDSRCILHTAMVQNRMITVWLTEVRYRMGYVGYITPHSFRIFGDHKSLQIADITKIGLLDNVVETTVTPKGDMMDKTMTPKAWKEWNEVMELHTRNGNRLDIPDVLQSMANAVGFQPPEKASFPEISPTPWRVGKDEHSCWIFDKNDRSVACVSHEANKALMLAAPDLRKQVYEDRKVLVRCRTVLRDKSSLASNSPLYYAVAESTDKSLALLKAAGVNVEDEK